MQKMGFSKGVVMPVHSFKQAVKSDSQPGGSALLYVHVASGSYNAQCINSAHE